MTDPELSEEIQGLREDLQGLREILLALNEVVAIQKQGVDALQTLVDERDER